MTCSYYENKVINILQIMPSSDEKFIGDSLLTPKSSA
jgi:hypothetical protein